jgi:AcrR family transcriptional regulator
MSALDPESQKAILDAAIQLCAEHEVSDITLDRLSRKSGVSQLMIVRQYQSNHGIVRAVLERELELMAAAAQSPELRMPGETVRDELYVLAGIILDQYRRRIPFLRNLLREALREPAIAAMFYKTFIVQGRLLFAEFLRERGSVGDLRPEIDVEAAAAIFLASLTGILLMHELFGGKDVEILDDERVLNQMCDLFLKGVATV